MPHCWDAGLLFEETTKTLTRSDLFTQNGDPKAFTASDIVEPACNTLNKYEQTPLAGYMPYTPKTGAILNGLTKLEPTTMATMHGSTFEGDGKRALHDLAGVMKEVIGRRRAWITNWFFTRG